MQQQQQLITKYVQTITTASDDAVYGLQYAFEGIPPGSYESDCDWYFQNIEKGPCILFLLTKSHENSKFAMVDADDSTRER